MCSPLPRARINHSPPPTPDHHHSSSIVTPHSHITPHSNHLLQVLCYEDNRLLKVFKDIVKLLYNAGAWVCYYAINPVNKECGGETLSRVE